MKLIDLPEQEHLFKEIGLPKDLKEDNPNHSKTSSILEWTIETVEEVSKSIKKNPVFFKTITKEKSINTRKNIFINNFILYVKENKLRHYSKIL